MCCTSFVLLDCSGATRTDDARRLSSRRGRAPEAVDFGLKSDPAVQYPRVNS